MSWYLLNNPEKVISPSLVFYKDRIESNIRSMVNIAGSSDRLVPHVKTHKCPEIVEKQLSAAFPSLNVPLLPKPKWWPAPASLGC